MILRDILNSKGTNVLTISASASLADAVQKLAENNCGSLVVVDDGRMIGIISERDIVRACADEPEMLAHVSVEQRMTSDVVTGAPDDDVNKIMGVMTDRRIRHLPVLVEGQLAPDLHRRRGQSPAQPAEHGKPLPEELHPELSSRRFAFQSRILFVRFSRF